MEVVFFLTISCMVSATSVCAFAFDYFDYFDSASDSDSDYD